MKIVVVHNAYRQSGGEDNVVAQEIQLLRDAGHSVTPAFVSNTELSTLPAKAKAFVNAAHNPDRARWIADIVAAERPDIVHIHNFFPLLTPAIHEGAAEAGAAVVQTLHNFRTICAAATLLRDGTVCEKCVSGQRLWGAVHRCYRNSLPASLAAARMQRHADRHRIWHIHVHRFIALTHFAREKFIAGGLPADRIAVKSTFVAPSSDASAPHRSGALYVGRLSPEKGLATLIEAWRNIPDHLLTIVGDGPLPNALRPEAPANVTFLGPQPTETVKQLMARASLLIVPSLWYEGMPMVVLEAFATGLPVLASRIGALAEMIEPGSTGALFIPGDAADLGHNANTLLAHPDTLAKMGARARHIADTLYSPARNLHLLEDIYREAIEAAQSQSAHK